MQTRGGRLPLCFQSSRTRREGARVRAVCCAGGTSVGFAGAAGLQVLCQAVRRLPEAGRAPAGPVLHHGAGEGSAHDACCSGEGQVAARGGAWWAGMPLLPSPSLSAAFPPNSFLLRLVLPARLQVQLPEGMVTRFEAPAAGLPPPARAPVHPRVVGLTPPEPVFVPSRSSVMDLRRCVLGFPSGAECVSGSDRQMVWQ